ncbi:tellurite resistance TerB family protein [Xanthobacter tagetidis]|uniref:tellurite resistance TerB family protein n=1 Tax=Xanthobacter tagetidis TaxID=60216 RepID=UPI0011C40F94|nr:DUF533 domain-containing protein [Xanthobacter tagetidis]MBB6309185.1 uncharacterized membrane protein YebE (DUF533 family) [Xanthobacter tagetidis]
MASDAGSLLGQLLGAALGGGSVRGAGAGQAGGAGGSPLEQILQSALGGGGQQGGQSGGLPGGLGDILGQVLGGGAAGGQGRGGQAGGGLGDILGQVLGGGAGQRDGGSGGGSALPGGLGDILGQVLGGGAGGRPGGAGGLPGGLGDILGQVLGGGAAGGAAGRAGGGIGTGGLGDLAQDALGGGQSAPMPAPSPAPAPAPRGGTQPSGGSDLVKYGGLAVIGMLAFNAFRKWQAQSGGSRLMADNAQAFSPAEAPGGPEHFSQVLVAAMAAAAQADGSLDPDELNRIGAGVTRMGGNAPDQAVLVEILSTPVNPQDLVNAATSPEAAMQIYAASVMAIRPDSAAEQRYLANLAQALAIDPALKAQLDRDLTA